MRYRGHVDALRNQVVDGWAVDLQTAETPVTVELTIDGEVVSETLADRLRPDLRDAQIGNGRHGFMMVIPDTAFDGRRHAVGARIKGSKYTLIGGRDGLLLLPDQRPQFEASVTGIEKGVLLCGRLRNTASGAEPVLVDLMLDGVAIAHAMATEKTGEGPAAVNHGFSFNLAAVWRPDLLAGRLECRAAGTRVSVPAAAAIAEALSAERVRLLDDRLEGSVRLPAFVPASVEIELLVNGERLQGLSWRSTLGEYGNSQRHFSTAFQFDAAAGAEAPSLEIRLRNLGYVIGGGSRLLVPMSPHGLVENPLFQSWLGQRPAHWLLDERVIERLVPEHCLLDFKDAEVPVFGPLALRFELRQDGNVGEQAITLLAQPLPVLHLPPGEALTWVVVGSAGRRVDAALVLELEGRDGTITVLREALRFAPRWSHQTGTLNLPSVDRPYQQAWFKLELPAGEQLLRLAAVGLGLPGFSMAPDASATLPEPLANGVEAAANAVSNGSFELWSRGLAFKAAQRQFETADGWLFYSKVPQPQLSLGLEKILARDPARAEPAREVYGLALQGNLQAACRLEATLDPVSLRARPPTRLRFFAGRKLRVANDSGIAIKRILLVQRTMVAATPEAVPLPHDETLCQIARAISLVPGGRFHEFRLQPLRREWSELLADFDLARPGASRFLLFFEFDEQLDCLLAEVDFGSDPVQANAAGEPGFVGLEDPNITHQLDRIKGLDLWASPKPIPSAPPAAAIGAGAAESGSAAKWRLPRPSFPSVDIIIPVFNARDDVLNCLRSIERNTGIPYLLTLIDDASDAPTALALAAFASTRPWVRLIVNEFNLGYTRSSNLGLAQSAADWVLLLNSDVIVTPGWLEGLFECALSDPKIKFVGALSNAASWQSVPEVFDARGKFKINALPEGWSVDEFAALVAAKSLRSFPRVSLLNGFCTLMERQTVVDLEFLDEIAFPVGYGEENDLCLRAIKAGHELAIADQVYIYHVKSASFGSLRRDGLSQAGNQQLLMKHPDVDLVQTQQHLRDLPSLTALRQALLEQLARPRSRATAAFV